MRFLIIFMFFAGILMIMHGMYKERIREAENDIKIEYRFIPRSYYDEQIFSSQFESKHSNLFDEEQDAWIANQRLFEKERENAIKTK